jgi:hypothetical protein
VEIDLLSDKPGAEHARVLALWSALGLPKAGQIGLAVEARRRRGQVGLAVF